MMCIICNNDIALGKKTCSKECAYKLRAKTRMTLHQPIEKECIACLSTFQDTTKKKLSVKCKDCAYMAGAQVRLKNGSYERTKEQNDKLSKTLKTSHTEGRHFTEEGLENLSHGLTERWRSYEFREKVKLGYRRNFGVDHHMKTAASRDAASKRGKNYRASALTRIAMCQAAAKRLREGRNQTQFYGKGGIRQDIGIYFRSRWEANFARYLQFTNQAFQYEPTSFSLMCGKTYTPDFMIGDTYYEVKGWWTQIAKEKFNAFCEEYPNVKLKIIGANEYNSIKDQYSNLIKTWERK